MRIWSLILFFLCFNASGYIIAQLVANNVFTNAMILGNTNSTSGQTTITDIHNQFDIGVVFSASNIMYGLIGAGLAAVVGIIMRQGVFAIYVILIWIVGIFLGLFSWILNGFPKMLEIILAGTGLEWLSYVLSTFMLAFFFMFLASLLAQRGDLT
jgi:hypothetical protein